MPYPHIFAALAGDQPASFLDDNFNAAQLLTGKDVASGYAGLDAGGFLANAQIVGGLGYTPVAPVASRGLIGGLQMSAVATNTLTIGAGCATDSTAAANLVLGSTYTKTTAAWAVGSGNGMLDTGAIAVNTWYHIYLIRRPDTGVVDIICSTNAAAPSLPASYTQFRRIGSATTQAASLWSAFIQRGDQFLPANAQAVVTNTLLGTTSTLFNMFTPLGITVKVRGLVSCFSPTAAGYVLINSPLQAAVAASPNGITTIGQQAGLTGGTYFEELTDTSAQIRAVGNLADTRIYLSLLGWQDSRGAG